MPAIPNLPVDLVRQFAGDGTVEEYYEGRVVAITLGELTVEHIDALFEEIERIYREWKHSSKPILLLIDATFGATTPSFRQRLMQLNAIAMTLPIKTRKALLVQEGHTKDVEVFATLTGSTGHRLSVFTDRERAVSWLEKALV